MCSQGNILGKNKEKKEGIRKKDAGIV